MTDTRGPRPRALSTDTPLNPGLSREYNQLLEAALPAASRRFLEEIMATRPWGFEILNKSYENGRAEGHAAGIADAVLRLLTDRKVRVNEAARERITACRDESQLFEWLRRATSVSTADELFA